MYYEDSTKTIVRNKIKKCTSLSFILSKISRPYWSTSDDLVFISLTSGVVKILIV